MMNGSNVVHRIYSLTSDYLETPIDDNQKEILIWSNIRFVQFLIL